jgi:quinol monooxygenase YgiN
MSARIAVIVTFEVRPEHAGSFLELVGRNAATSVTVEAGCFRFDVIAPRGTSEVHLYEIYGSREAFDAHLATQHFLDFDAATKAMVLSKRVVVGDVSEAAKAGS